MANGVEVAASDAVPSEQRKDGAQSPTMARLEDQITWYDGKSVSNQQWYKRQKIAVIVASATIPLAAGIGAPAWVAAGLGVAIVVIEGLQQLNKHQELWMSYRSTAEALKHEKYLFLGLAGPYEDIDNPLPVLAERVESLVSQEHAKWVSTTRKENDSRSSR
jgi:hypothetical protein